MEVISQGKIHYLLATLVLHFFSLFQVLFKDRLLGHFTTILLQTLMHKTHALLNDEVQLAVFNMASVNFDFFFNSLLRQFVSTVDGVAVEQWDVLVRNFVHYHDKVTRGNDFWWCL